jgi:hypothetical protein
VPKHSFIDEVSTSKRILANGRVRTDSDLEILHSLLILVGREKSS